MGTGKKLVLVFVALALFVVGGASLLALKFLEEPASSSTEITVFDVKPGEGFKVVAHHLQEVGLVSSARKLDLYAKISGVGAKIRVGEYAIRRDLNPRQVVAILVSGKSIEYSVTVPEGSNRFEIAENLGKQGIIKKEDFLAMTSDPKLASDLVGEPLQGLEGYLFPETYHITKFTGTRGLIKMMVDRFKENFAKVKPLSTSALSNFQLVTLASIVEKETGAPEERAVIASVFYNRLKKHMRLQTDPTIVYGIWEKTGVWDKNISKADLMRPSRYNTYVIEGLPYGPISNPGLDALKAAANPAQTEFLFFVSRNNGTHVFSKDYSQHQAAVGQFQLDKKARDGKSWRDLKKRAGPAPDHVYSADAEKPAHPPAKDKKTTWKKN